jgi:hypothetical protein
MHTFHANFLFNIYSYSNSMKIFFVLEKLKSASMKIHK